MKASDIPQTDEIIDYYSNLIESHATLTAKYQQRAAGETRTGIPHCVGGGFLRSADAEQLLPIDLDDAMFRDQHPFDWSDLPLAAIVRTVAGDYRIHINTIARKLYLHSITRDLITGLLAHEAGHYMAGHVNMTVDPPVAIRPISFQHMTKRLLSGGIAGDASELEANLHAISIVGMGPVLAILAMQSSRSYNIGLRIEFSNQLHRLLKMTGPDFTLPKSPYTSFGFTLYSDAAIGFQKDRS